VEFNWVDWLFVAIITLSTLFSLLRGFVREAMSLLIWIAATIITWSFSSDLAAQLQGLDIAMFELPQIRLIVACFILFLGTLMIGALLNYFIYRIIKLADASSMDKFLGTVFGAARGGVLVLVIVGVVNATSLSQLDWWQQSILQVEFGKVALWAQQTINDLL